MPPPPATPFSAIYSVCRQCLSVCLLAWLAVCQMNYLHSFWAQPATNDKAFSRCLHSFFAIFPHFFAHFLCTFCQAKHRFAMPLSPSLSLFLPRTPTWCKYLFYAWISFKYVDSGKAKAATASECNPCNSIDFHVLLLSLFTLFLSLLWLIACAWNMYVALYYSSYIFDSGMFVLFASSGARALKSPANCRFKNRNKA